ncbi:MAG: UV DNA damage repair endonuclease UvsE, partial [Aquificaceae bacterium]|nr:UV DNA damage repair endonuclease UvsE [Aquificaceae bacterium]
LTSKNAEDFIKLLNISSSLNLRVFRLGSDFVPFASHESFKKEWIKEVENIILDIKPKVRSFNIRITMHPGQFVVLNSPNQKVIDSSLRELEYHFWLLDLLGLCNNSVVVIHLGGQYGNKKESIERFIKTIRANKWLTQRLVVENDEKNYAVADLFSVAEEGIGIVFDYYHHSLNPSSFEPADIIKSWGGRRPEFHLSSKPKGPHRFGEHGDWITLEDFLSMKKMFQHYDYDIIIEAKKKELAIIRLLNQLESIETELNI